MLSVCGPFVHLEEYFLCAYLVPGTLLQAGDTAANKTDGTLALTEFTFQWWEDDELSEICE